MFPSESVHPVKVYPSETSAVSVTVDPGEYVPDPVTVTPMFP